MPAAGQDIQDSPGLLLLEGPPTTRRGFHAGERGQFPSPSYPHKAQSREGGGVGERKVVGDVLLEEKNLESDF